jgi:valyl-tRNA synthetase
MVPRCARTGQVIEPMLTDQWFVAMSKPAADGKSITQKALDVVASGEIKFYPENWVNTYNQWLNNIQDWCISRQLWWGHQIPAWYDQAGKSYVGYNEKEVREYYQLDPSVDLRQDQDVLDTWFSSALWPFATLGWPEDHHELSTFFPTTALVTGFDIIFFWVARMIMFSLYFTGKVPFKDIYIHGLIQDHQGMKMSKSKGNVIDPIDLIDGISLEDLLKKRTQGLMQPEKAASIAAATQRDFPQGLSSYGADALRLTFCQQASPGRFIRFDTQRMQASHNFCNKLWNMMRFTLLQLDEYQAYQGNIIHPIHHWILNQVSFIQEQSSADLAEYRFDLLAQRLVDFVWTTVCDQYLEFAKVLLKSPETKAEAQCVLVKVIQSVLHILHPIMPFITEELAFILHKKITPNDSYLHLVETTQEATRSSPYIDDQKIFSLIEFIVAIRTIRSKLDVVPKAHIDLVVKAKGTAEQLWYEFEPFIRDLAKVATVQHYQQSTFDDKNMIASHFNQEEFSLILQTVTVDNTVQRERLLLDRAKCIKEIEKAKQKLGNESFVSKAPASVVEQEQQRLAEYQVQLSSIEASLALLS